MNEDMNDVKQKSDLKDHLEKSENSEEEGHFTVHQNVNFDKHHDPQDFVEKTLLEEEDPPKNRNILSEDVEFKLEELLDDIQEEEGKNFQSIITLRMKELAYNKILVLTYGRPVFRLVMAYFHIGREYLRFSCYEQALKHLQSSIAENKKAGESLSNKLYYSYQLTYLGQTLYFLNRFEEAKKNLERSVNLQTECEEKNRKVINNIRTLKYLALVKAELKEEDCLAQIKLASQKASKFLSSKNQQSLSYRQYGLLLYEEGRIQLQGGNRDQAIKKYKEAIEQIKMHNQPNSEEDAIKIYQELASIYESISQEKYLLTLKQKYQVFEDCYGNADKRTIKEQRSLALSLLKYKMIDESLEQCEDILEKEKRVFGENSLQVGKELKTIANILLAKEDFKQVENHLKKAMKIFHDLGEQRLQREVKAKLTSLQVNHHN